ncbi:MAG: tRNA 2-thiouridine(34) synthase MnmA [Clostridiales bacterium]|jgi:tRNA-specific 2-thiouridylase|nr:tRNA 2-thiouridine(34) synthase MnmA [Clostridiales bacterium]
MKKVFSAMSGGVDSSVATLLLKQNGYDVSGVMLKMFETEDTPSCAEACDANSRTCCSFLDSNDARNVATKLGIPFYLLNYKDIFKNEVISRFIEGYKNGITPNPCIDCNRYVKFGALFDTLDKFEQDYLATGHYSIIEYDKTSKRWLLKKSTDITKDQSYVLYNLTQNQLSKTLLPLGKMTKNDVRDIANENGFINANKPDSQDICFVPNGKYTDFLAQNGINPKIGDIVNTEGEILGKHNGYFNYTIGQRKGLGISSSTPLYVCNIDAKNNIVTVGTEDKTYKNSLIAKDINWVSIPNLQGSIKCNARVRYNSKEVPAVVHAVDDNKICVEFLEKQKYIANGQAVVLYDENIVLGGGIICKAN